MQLSHACRPPPRVQGEVQCTRQTVRVSKPSHCTAGAADFAEWFGLSDPTRQGVSTSVKLTRDAATGIYSFSTGAYWPADGLKGGIANAQGHSSYFTTALSVCSPAPSQWYSRCLGAGMKALHCLPGPEERVCVCVCVRVCVCVEGSLILNARVHAYVETAADSRQARIVLP